MNEAQTRKKQKIVHLTSVHQAGDTRILHRECAALNEAGFDVVFVVPHVRDEAIGGIRIRGVPVGRRRLARWTRTLWRVLRAARAENATVYHLHDPELLLLAPLLHRGGAKVVFDAHEDIYLQILAKHWIPEALRSPVASIAQWLEEKAGAWVDAFVAATPAIASKLPQSRTVVVQNFPITAELRSSDAQAIENRSPVAVYIGGLTVGRGAKTMVAAMGQLPDDVDLTLMLAGRWVPTQLLEEVSAIRGWSRVRTMPWQDREGVRDLLGQARMGLVLLHPEPNHLESYPVKLFEYMAAGIPVIISDIPLWRSIVEDAKCGIPVNPTNPSAIADAMLELLKQPDVAREMGAQGHLAAATRYSWNSEKRKLLELYERLLG